MKNNAGKKMVTGTLAGMLVFAAAAGCFVRNIQTVNAQTLYAESESTSEEESMFTERDLEQTADLTEAVSLALEDGKDIRITEAGVYVLSGEASDVTVYVEAADEDKVQIVLDGANITNTNEACIYIKSADKVFITTSTDSMLSSSGAFEADGDTNVDGVIFSRSDLTLNGSAKLTISSDDNGVVTKDDLKITGGEYAVTTASKAFEANDSIRIAGGSFEISAGTDAFHAENEDDDSLGYIFIEDGSFTITAGDDGIHGNAYVQIEGGTYTIKGAEGIEGTYILIEDGTIDIEASDDGINAAQKSTSYEVAMEINGGSISVSMAQGDTDGIDSNGSLTITGGTIDVTAQSAFDIDGTVTFTGGTVIVNGQQVDSIPNQMMGGFGDMQGGAPGMQGGAPGMQGGAPGMQGGAPGMQGGRPGMQGGGPGMQGGGSDTQRNSRW